MDGEDGRNLLVVTRDRDQQRLQLAEDGL